MFRLVILTIFTLIAGLPFSSCTTNKAPGSGNESGSTQKVAAPNYSTLFIDAVITCDTSSTRCSVEIIKTILSPIKLKKGQSSEDEIHPNSLVCTFMDTGYKTLKTIVISNPLSQSIEYLNDKNEYRRINDTRKSANFNLRIDYNPNIKYLKIEKIDKDMKKSQVSILEIFLHEKNE